MHSKYLWFYECLKLPVHGQKGNTCSCTRVKINCVPIYINSSGLQKTLAALGSEEVYRSQSIWAQEILYPTGGATSYHIYEGSTWIYYTQYFQLTHLTGSTYNLYWDQSSIIIIIIHSQTETLTHKKASLSTKTHLFTL